MSRSMTERMVGAARLDIAVFEEVEHDETATVQAAGVVAMVAVFMALGGTGAGPIGMLTAAGAQLFGWVVWAGLTHFIGTRIFGGTATWGELLRTLGFAQAPGVLALLAIVPLVGWMILPVLGIWMLVAGVIAVRQALDVDTGKAIFTVAIGWLVMVVAQGFLR
jgi:hypothetical protein